MKLRADRLGPAPFLIALVGWAGVIGGIALFRSEIGIWDGRATAASVILVIFLAPFAAYGTLAMLFGAPVVEIDPTAGRIRYEHLGKEQWNIPLAELGALSIRETQASFDLVAANRDHALFKSPRRELVEQRRATIEALVAQSAVRQILEVAPEDGGGFRDAPDAATQASQAVTDAAKLRAAVKVLADEDDDPQIRARAAELLRALERE